MPKLATVPNERPSPVTANRWERPEPATTKSLKRRRRPQCTVGPQGTASRPDPNASLTHVSTRFEPNSTIHATPTKPAKNPAIAFVERHLEIAQDRLDRLCRQHRLSVEEAEDFRSTAILRLLEKSNRLERQYQGRSNLATYFDAVLGNILRDYRVAKWGKWRPSARATHLGPLAVSLERLIHRDRLCANEAVNILARTCFPCRRTAPEALQEELWEILARLPVRVDRRAVIDSDALEEQLADQGAEARVEIKSAVQELDSLRAALLKALAELSSRQRTVLRLRYAQGLTFAEIEHRTGMRTESLYRQVARTLRTLRRLVTDSGVSAATALEAHKTGAGDFCLERLFEAAGV